MSVCPSSAVLLSLSVLGGCPSVCPGVWLCVRTPLAVGVPVHFPGVHLLGCLSVPYPQRPPSVPRGVCPSSRCLSTHWGVHRGVQVCIEVSLCRFGRPSPLPPHLTPPAASPSDPGGLHLWWLEQWRSLRPPWCFLLRGCVPWGTQGGMEGLCDGRGAGGLTWLPQKVLSIPARCSCLSSCQHHWVLGTALGAQHPSGMLAPPPDTQHPTMGSASPAAAQDPCWVVVSLVGC